MNAVKKVLAVGLVSAILVGCQSSTRTVQHPYSEKPVVYPTAMKGDVVDDFHGVKVADPYRWLEDADSPESRAWIEAENKITFAYLGEIPVREKIEERITKLYDYEKFGMPFKEGDRYFYSHNDGLQNQSVYFWKETLDGEPRVLIDPNKLSEDGTVALGGFSVSHDGKLAAYAISDAGSDWQEWHVREIDSGQDRPDIIKWAKFTGASWTKDDGGFYYSRFEEPNEDSKLEDANYFQKIYFHKMGTPQSQDELIYERPDHKDWLLSAGVTEDGQYLIISVRSSEKRDNLIFYQELNHPGSPIIELISEFEARYSVIDNDGPVFWVKTNLDAPKSRVIAIDTRSPAKSNWEEIIPETNEPLKGVGVINNMFVASYLKDAHTQVKFLDLNGNFVREVKFPGLCTAYGFGGKRHDTETFYAYTSFTDPGSIYRYDAATGESELYKRPKIDFDPDQYTIKQIFYSSKDDTRVPMFLAHKKGIKLNGKNPTYLYAYGGFNISQTPYFSVTNQVWMEMGGVFAVANIRGGGEYGKEWHEAAITTNRQVAFDDFIAAAEWLIDRKYTCSEKLAIGGGSNGGLLVGACLTQRPELYGAALPAVGVMDMLRFHKFTIGYAWVSDYGSPDNPEQFPALYAYSPYHNIRKGTSYPATLITTADHDDRVFPAHSFEFAAAIQEAQAGDAPVLIRIETRAGHGAGKPTKMRIEEAADRWAFLVRALDMNPKL